MEHKEALELIRDMNKNGVWYKQYHEALTIAIKDMEERALPACTCGNAITAFCTKCGGYVPNTVRRP